MKKKAPSKVLPLAAETYTSFPDSLFSLQRTEDPSFPKGDIAGEEYVLTPYQEVLLQQIPDDLGVGLVHAVHEAGTRLIHKGHGQAVEHYLTSMQKEPRPLYIAHAVWSATASLGSLPALEHKKEITRKGKLAISLLAWNECFGDEEKALARLFYLFQLDCRFFLEQPWVQGLLASWIDQGAREKLERAFWGTGGSGVRAADTNIARHRRNKKLYEAVEARIKAAGSLTAAIRQLTRQVQENLGIHPTLSQGGVKKAYQSYKAAPDILAKRRTPPGSTET